MAFSWSKVPSARLRELRSPMGMLTPGVLTTGVAEARRARATETRVALQNIVESLAGLGELNRWGGGEQENLMTSPAALDTA